ncbi:hypothetical protein Glove_296g49 [Diversispora epigaea]|uniref:Uncharacterized protein n=1 Tax=Diversispora epigaea TaxID=1348612 RepID=A0A397I4Q1_9GLOM|nr:hypothetical protein Glove_296g49 [Diversispora epigaea]
MVNTVIETINGITANYESLRAQLDHLTETSSIAPLRSEQFTPPASTSNSSRRSSYASSKNNYSLDDMCNIVSVEILGSGQVKPSPVSTNSSSDDRTKLGGLPLQVESSLPDGKVKSSCLHFCFLIT